MVCHYQPYLLFELLVDSVQCVLNRYSLQVPGSDFEPKREVQINLLDRRVSQEFFQYCRIIYRRW